MTVAFSAALALPRSTSPSGHIRGERRRAGITCSTADDLMVVGAGTLGLKAAKLWREKHPEAAITCATWTEARHEEIVREGFSVTVASKLGDGDKSPYVLFCAPPGAAGPEYGSCVAQAAKLASTKVLFTSSTAAYADAPVITENSPLSDSPRAQRLIRAEESVLSLDTGCVARLAGLYTGSRGPHSFWLRRGACGGGPGGMLNMLHYDDAASFAVAALKSDTDTGTGDKVYLASDGNPLTRKELLDVALDHPRFNHFPFPKWTEGTDHVKTIDGSASNAKLKWKPRWNTFKEFMEAEANFIYNSVPIPV